MATPSLSELTAEREALLHRLSPTVTGDTDNPLYSGTSLWQQGLSPVAAQSVQRLLEKTDDGTAAILQSDVELLRELLTGQADLLRRSPLGWMDAAFPIVENGQVVGCVWSRRFMDRPFTDDELNRITELAGVDRNTAEKAAGKVTLLSGQEQQAMLDQADFLREAVQSMVQESGRAGVVSQQLMQSERARALGTLSTGVAHHFNNLLSVILGYSSFVLNSEEVSQEASGALAKISAAAQKGRRLTEEILAFAGSEVETETACELHGMLTSILSLLQSQYTSKVKIEQDFQADNDTVTAPASAVHHLMFNLLTSAFDSNPTGGTIRIATTNVDGLNGERSVKLAITDSGGMVRDRASGGSEVKLARAEGIAGSLSGSVSITAQPGQMTRVEVTLPCGTGVKTPEGAPPSTIQTQSSRVWVVDDDAIFRQMCRQTLESEGHIIEEMESGPEMQQRWQSDASRPELIIIDFSMPDYNGLELCEWLQENQSTIPVVLVSGFADNHPDIHQALQFKRTFFLQKPFSFREMLDTVTVALAETLIPT